MKPIKIGYWLNTYQALSSEYAFKGALSPELAEKVETKFEAFKKRFIKKLCLMNEHVEIVNSMVSGLEKIQKNLEELQPHSNPENEVWFTEKGVQIGRVTNCLASEKEK